jgi:hypothetical protein
VIDKLKAPLDPTDGDLFLLAISEDQSALSLLSGTLTPTPTCAHPHPHPPTDPPPPPPHTHTHTDIHTHAHIRTHRAYLTEGRRFVESEVLSSMSSSSSSSSSSTAASAAAVPEPPAAVAAALGAGGASSDLVWTPTLEQTFGETKRQLRAIMAAMDMTRPWRHAGLIDVLRAESLVRVNTRQLCAHSLARLLSVRLCLARVCMRMLCRYR